MYEGVPQYPDKDGFWDIVERYGVTILYTAPTAIRTMVRWGDDGLALNSVSLGYEDGQLILVNGPGIAPP